MNRAIMLTALLLLPMMSAAAQEGSDIPPPPPPDCDWEWYYNSPWGLATQPGHDVVESGWNCRNNQPMIDYIWRELDFLEIPWTTSPNNGFSDPCDARPPIGRAINAAVLLGYSGSRNPNCDFDVSNALNWALCWAASRYAEFSTTCSAIPSNRPLATTYSNPIFGDSTTVWVTGLYEQEVVELAGTLFHEARHYDCNHNAGSDCVRGSSCDESWADGCPWPEDGDGANRYQVTWLAWYANHGIRGTVALKEFGIIRANEVLSSGFHRDPCFRLAFDGTPIDARISGC